MTVIDRRSGSDRRLNERFRVSIDIEWESGSGTRKNGTLSDIGLGGCFVLSAGEVADGEMIRLFIPMGRGMRGEFICEVVNHVFEIGFAVKFSHLSESQWEFIENFVDTIQKSEN